MINWFNMPDEGLSNGGLFEVKELEVTENGTYETKGEMYNKVTVNVEGGGGGSSDLTWILPEQTVTLVDQPVEITGLRLDLIPANTNSVPIKIITSDLGSNAINYRQLTYSDGSLETSDGIVSIYSIDGTDYFVVGEEGVVSSGEYTISIALF